MDSEATLNSHPLNQRSREILTANAIPWSPRTELASLALISISRVQTPAFQAGRFYLQPSCCYG